MTARPARTSSGGADRTAMFAGVSGWARWISVAVGLAILGFAGPADAQLSSEDIAALRERGRAEGWTFTVGESDATRRSLDELCGLIEPPDWRLEAPTGPSLPTRGLPSSYDWRDYNGCTPIRNQASCGSCWAFAAIGAMECGILIRDGISVDLAEQWLVSCTDAGSCWGGWHTTASNYLLCNGLTDPCGDSGAVFEADFPYTATDAMCLCPYYHPYCLDSWTYIGSGTDQIKQAIMTYGPVATTVYVNSAFHGYSGGVFNDCDDNSVNHAVVLVGWDDNQGANGVWFLRNSWGPWWGESGYMRIEYGCSRVGYATLYMEPHQNDCNGNNIADSLDISGGTSQDCNGNFIPDECDTTGGGSRDCNGDLIPDECELAGNDCNGNFDLDDCDIALGTSGDCNGNGLPDECESGTRSGLAGAYYDNMDFTGLLRGRLDQTIDFDWGSDQPLPGFGSDTFGVRWSGFVHTPGVAGVYTFYTITDDGVRLWVDDQLIIDQWVDQGPTEWSGTVTLEANSAYPIVMEYFENSGLAMAELRWEPPGQPKAIIEAASLSPGRDCNHNLAPDECDLLGGISGDCNGNLTPDECESPDCDGNAVPDGCDIAADPGLDLNVNGIPDSCEAEPRLESGVTTVGDSTVTVPLSNTYDSPVVVCSVQYDNNTLPVVTRVSNVTPTSFDVHLQNPSGDPVTADNVSYLVIEEGVTTIDGVEFEAWTYTSTIVDLNLSWVGQQRRYHRSHVNPVVLGQVMSENDPDWSVFWCQGATADDPPSPTLLRTGKHVGSDLDVTRAPETIGVVVTEAGHATIGGVGFEARLGDATVQGLDDTPPYPYVFDTAFATAPTVAVLSQAGMIGADGSWAQAYGPTLATTTTLNLSLDEDQLGDAERRHTTERVAYAVFEAPLVYPSVGDGDFDLDGDVDLEDFGSFQLCFDQSAGGACQAGDMNGDDLIDAADIGPFVNALIGP